MLGKAPSPLPRKTFLLRGARPCWDLGACPCWSWAPTLTSASHSLSKGPWASAEPGGLCLPPTGCL